MVKRDFTANIENQIAMKKNSISESKVIQLEDEKRLLLERIKEFEAKKDITGTVKIELNQIKLVSNIRDNLDYEEIDSLARNIKELGQLQPVLLTNDNNLIAGYRRYNAVKLLGNKGPGFLYALKLEKNYDEIEPELFIKIQYSENENRRSLDNFHISKLFNEFLAKGKNQREICDIFGKTKSFVSSVIALKKIDPDLVKYLKEFQIYAWSKKVFTGVNIEDNEEHNKFYSMNKGILGWKPLYSIAKFDEISDQKKAFLKLYKNRLSEEELNSEFFKEQDLKTKNKGSEKRFSNAVKSIKNLSEMFNEITENLSENEIKDFENAKKYLAKLENILLKNAKKIK
jgi:ParB/RepB/Spo0J family partition protein